MEPPAIEHPERPKQAGTGGSAGRFVAFVRVVHPRPPPAEMAAGNDRLGRIHAFGAGVGEIAEAAGARSPLAWDDDGVTLLIPGDEPAGLPLLAYRVAEQIRDRAKVELDWPVPVAAHVARVRSLDPSDPDLAAGIVACREAAGAPSAPALAVTEDVALGLPEGLREALVRLRDRAGEPVYSLGDRTPRSPDDPVGELCDGLRRYVRGSDFARLRYVGFRLQRKEPPSLDVREVFVPQRVRPRRDRSGERPPYGREAHPGAPGLPAGRDGLSAGEEAMSARQGLSPLALEAAVGRHASLVFLGDPGSGKTTLLCWLAVIAAGGRFAWAAAFGRAERWIPVPLSVGRITELRRSFAPSHPSVLDVAARNFRERNVHLDEPALREALHEVLSAGQALVLLDGLDEVRADERAAIRGWLESFAAQYPRCRFFASSREVGYSGFTVAGGEEMRVEPFDAPQVERFVHAFVRGYRRMEIGEDEAAASRKIAEDFLAALKRDSRLGALARNPFLLSALALMHRSETRLPRHRVLAYELFARALCETWADARRLVAGETGEPSISYEDEALPVLGHLALAMHEEHPDGAAPEAFVLDTLEEALSQQKRLSAGEARRAAKAFLARAGEEVQILLPRGPEQWGFLHLTFQEFFAAAGLHAQERFEEVLFERLFDPRWLEVLRLGIGYLALVQKRHRKVNELVLRVLDWKEPGPRAWLTEKLQKQVVRAAQLAAEAGDALREDVQARVVAATVEWMMAAPWDASGEVLSSVDAYDFARPLAHALLEAISSEGWSDFEATKSIEDHDSEPVAEEERRILLGGSEDRLRTWLARLPEDVIAANLERMAEQPRRVAADYLAHRRLMASLRSPSGWRDALRHPVAAHRALRAARLETIDARIALDNDEGHAILMEALGDTARTVRLAALEAFLSFPRWSPEVGAAMRDAVPLLKGEGDPSWQIVLAHEATAVSAIEPFVATLLTPIAGQEGRSSVMAHLARALSRSAISGRVKDALVKETRAGVDAPRRAAAVAALAYWDSDEAVAAAAYCLSSGPDSVRLFALWALARLDPERGSELWLDLVRSPSFELRTMAMYSLSHSRWPFEKRTLLRDLLLDLAERDSDERVQFVALMKLRDFRSPQVVDVLTRLASTGRHPDTVLDILAGWGIEDAATFAERLDPETSRDVLWKLSENLPPGPHAR